MLPDIYVALLIIFACSILVSIIFQKLKQPSIVGFLLTGILVGPHALGLLDSVEQIETLAEVGVTMLLFTIGMEFSIKDLLKFKLMALGGGLGQAVLTIALGTGAGVLLGIPLNSAIFLGFILYLSSTAIGLSLLQKYDAMGGSMGRLCLLILIFQDIMVAPLMLLVPVLGGAVMSTDASSWHLLVKGVGAIVLIIVIARWVMPLAMKHIAASQSKELFIIGLVTLCIGVCSLTVWAGLSLAMGAFIAGLMIASSPYNHQAIGYIIPLRDIFTSIFFVSIGMLLDVNFLAQHPFMVLGATVAIIVGKTVIAGGVALVLGLPVAQSILVGIALSQVGEFSFVLAGTGMELELLSEGGYQFFLAAAVLTMVCTPLCFSVARGRLLNWRNNWALCANRPAAPAEPAQQLKDHIVIVGFGPTGRLVARAARMVAIPYIIVEMNSTTVHRERERGENIIFGDVANDAIMEHVNITQARVLVVSANTPFLIRRVVTAARRMSSNLYIITRSRFIQNSREILELGANEVVSEEFETALDMFARVLRQLAVPYNDIARLVFQLKNENYDLLQARPLQKADHITMDEYLPGYRFIILRVEKGSLADGKTLAALDLRKKYGVNVLAIKSGEVVDSHIHHNSALKADDLTVLLTPHSRLDEVQHEVFMFNLCAGKNTTQ